MFINIVFVLDNDKPSGLLSFLPALLLSIVMAPFLPFSSFSLCYFILSVPMLECLGKHSCMSSLFPIAILNSIFFVKRHDRNGQRVSCRKLTIIIKYTLLL